jgi:hypothetical protein
VIGDEIVIDPVGGDDTTDRKTVYAEFFTVHFMDPGNDDSTAI